MVGNGLAELEESRVVGVVAGPSLKLSKKIYKYDTLWILYIGKFYTIILIQNCVTIG